MKTAKFQSLTCLFHLFAMYFVSLIYFKGRNDFLKSLIGSEGVAITKIKYCGYVEVEGEIHEALSKSIPIEKNEPIIVIDVLMNRLVVRKKRDFFG